MTTSDSQSEAIPGDDFIRSWRYNIGLTLIIVGNLGILIGVLLGVVGVGAATIGALMVGGEVVSLASIVFLGKEGFKAIKNKVVAFAKSPYTTPVGKTRHYIGVTLLLTNVVTNFLMMLYSSDAFAVAAAEGPAAAVWGLDIETQGSLVLWLFMIGELSFLVGIYVLGADWWDKFRRIFVWEAPEKS
jgi:hypothetical protein